MVARPFIASLLLAASAASAQVIYEPPVTQHGGQSPYYYAGTDPLVHEAARFPRAEGAVWGRVGGFAFVSPRRQVVERRVRTFTDAFGTTDARPYGLTPNQVNNEANARLPRYFRKGDLLAGARQTDGAGPFIVTPFLEVPRGTILIRPAGPPHQQRRGPVLVVPREMMDRKVSDVVRPTGRPALTPL